MNNKSIYAFLALSGILILSAYGSLLKQAWGANKEALIISTYLAVVITFSLRELKRHWPDFLSPEVVVGVFAIFLATTFFVFQNTLSITLKSLERATELQSKS